jgi:hypothetical protein
MKHSDIDGFPIWLLTYVIIKRLLKAIFRKKIELQIFQNRFNWIDLCQRLKFKTASCFEHVFLFNVW